MTPLPPPIEVRDPEDSRLDDYRALKEQRLKEDSGKFVAESEGVVRRLLASSLEVRSLLVNETKWKALQQGSVALPPRPGVSVYLASQAVMDAVAGFHVHRGCLAIGVRPPVAQVPAHARLVLALEDLVDVENVGGIVRNAAAFGADALVLSPRTADPYFRKAVRVAMGNTFTLPIWRTSRWPQDLLALRAQRSARLVGAVVQPEGATPLPRFSTPGSVIVLLGAEGPGLSPQIRALCDELVTIPMVGADSLNVATAAAVVLYHLRQLVPTPAPV